MASKHELDTNVLQGFDIAEQPAAGHSLAQQRRLVSGRGVEAVVEKSLPRIASIPSQAAPDFKLKADVLEVGQFRLGLCQNRKWQIRTQPDHLP